MIIFSTKLSTQALVIAQYGGTTWISHSGYVLRGATSGVTANSATKTGGNDNAIIPYHNHTFQQPVKLGNGTASWNATAITGNSQSATPSAGGIAAMPSSTTSYAGTSGNTTNANIPNYKSVYIWERTA